MGYFNDYRNFPKSIYYIFLSRIINSIGAFVGPLLTLLLTDKIGLSTEQAGLFVTVSTAMYTPASMVGGYLSDKFNRKNTLCLLTMMQAICYLICGFIEISMIVPYLLLAASFFSNAAQCSSAAMAADLSNKNNRQGTFSLLYLGTNIGFSVGPLIAGFLYKNFLPLLFIGDAFTTIISVIIIYLNVPETKPQYDLEEEILLEDFGARGRRFGSFCIVKKTSNYSICNYINVIVIFIFSGSFFTSIIFKCYFWS